MQAKTRRTVGTIIFLAGIAAGLALAVVVLWGDLEAASYFNSGAGYGPFAGLHCPALMSSTDAPTISATFDNRGDREVQPYYVVEISGESASRKLQNQITVPAHSAKTVSWTVSASDVDLGSFVMMKIDVLPYAGNPTRESTCGMMIVNLDGLSGGQVLGWGLGISLVAMLVGIGLSEFGPDDAARRKQSVRAGMRAAAVMTSLALLTALLGWWLFSLLLCGLTVLLLLIVLRMATS